ncbi:MAG: transketolase C-terminal domain-containing protein, partial [Deferrisomatales bacterium]
DLEEAEDYRSAFGDFDLDLEETEPEAPTLDPGAPVTYDVGAVLTTRAAFGEALAGVARANRGRADCPIAVVDCGDADDLGTGIFARENRDAYFHCGVQDHAAATTAGALSLEGVVTVFADVGVFGLDGAYNQLRLNDINRTNLKVVATRLGLDAGEEGKAVQCVDYLSLAENLYGFRPVFPADPNQADRAVRYVLAQPGNWLVGLGATPAPVITDLDGRPFFAGDYAFEYGRLDLVRPGDHGVILTTGQLLSKALVVWEALREKGLEPSVLHVSSPKALESSEDPVLLQCLRKGRVITYEDHNVHTGLGSRVANYIAIRGISCRLMKIGVERYGASGTSAEVYRKLGLDPESLVGRAQKFLKR